MIKDILLGVGVGWSLIGGFLAIATPNDMFIQIINYIIFLIIFIGLIVEDRNAN